MVKQAALEETWRRIHLTKGAVVNYVAPAHGAAPVAAGRVVELRFPVRITGPRMLAVDTTLRIRVRNVAPPAAAAERLLYSNHPESVAAPGLLYQATVESGVNNRLFFHHQNHTPARIRVIATLTNPSDTAVDCLLTPALAGPHRDPVLTGHRAAARFLPLYRDGAALVARIPAHSARVVADIPTGPLETVSGIIDVRPMGEAEQGAPSLVCQVRAAKDVVLSPADASLLAEPAGPVYTPASQQVAGRYSVGGNWTFLDLGQPPVASPDGSSHLDGNYGVMYTVQIELVNPLSEEHVAILAVAPRAGWARGAFLIDGRLVEAAAATSPQEVPLAQFRLRPGETRRVTIATLPCGGSSYPIWLLARSDAAATRAGAEDGLR
jgi:hypothetical protein